MDAKQGRTVGNNIVDVLLVRSIIQGLCLLHKELNLSENKRSLLFAANESLSFKFQNNFMNDLRYRLSRSVDLERRIEGLFKA